MYYIHCLVSFAQMKLKKKILALELKSFTSKLKTCNNNTPLRAFIIHVLLLYLIKKKNELLEFKLLCTWNLTILKHLSPSCSNKDGRLN